jgi:hypothetical protein
MERKIKNVHLGKTDDDVLEFIEQLPNFSEWVRRQARREMACGGDLKALIEGIVDERLKGIAITSEQQKEIQADLKDFF